jgi:hypothetical protein
METYKIKYPPLSSPSGLHWDEIELSQENAILLVDAGIISKKIPDVVETKLPEAEETKPLAKLLKK